MMSRERAVHLTVICMVLWGSIAQAQVKDDLAIVSMDAWPILSQVPAEVMTSASFVVVGEWQDGAHALVHTQDKRTFLYGRSKVFGLDTAGNNEKTELGGIELVDAQMSQAKTCPFISVLTADGFVYTVGCNEYSQLGHHERTEPQKEFFKVTGLTGVVEIAIGGEYTIARTRSDKVYGWGHNIVNGYYWNRSPELIYSGTDDKAPIQIATGSEHSVLLTVAGEVLTWGSNYYGQIGLDHMLLSDDLELRTMGELTDKKIVQVRCGGHFSLALSSDGTLYSWGAGSMGQLGINGTIQKWIGRGTILPQEVSISGRVADMRADLGSAIAVTDQGDIYRWGWYDGDDVWGPVLVYLEKAPSDVFARGVYTRTAGKVRLSRPSTETTTEYPVYSVTYPQYSETPSDEFLNLQGKIQALDEALQATSERLTTANEETRALMQDESRLIGEREVAILKNVAEMYQEQEALKKEFGALKKSVVAIENTLEAFADAVTKNLHEKFETLSRNLELKINTYATEAN